MKKHNYKKLEIYQRSLHLACELVPCCDSIRPFRLSEQIAGSCISVPSNIAEGTSRQSQHDFIRFLEYAAGSAAELETQLIIYRSIQKQPDPKIETWVEETVSIYSMIQAFIHACRRNAIPKSPDIEKS